MNGKDRHRIRWDCSNCGRRANRSCEPNQPPCSNCGGSLTPRLGKNVLLAENDFMLQRAMPWIERELGRREMTNITIADVCGLSVANMDRHLSGELKLRWFQADAVAVNLGTHPANIWPEWSAILIDGSEQ